MLSIMVSAGEASGDAHAAHALEALDVPYTSFGMGASELEAQGTELLVDCRDLAVIGFVDVLKNYHRFLKRLSLLRQAMAERKPDLLFLTDFPDFNLKLAETAKSLGIPVLFYVSPQLWAWRSGRIHRIGRLVDHMAVLFPFEVPYYTKENIPVTYVGNPVVESAVSQYDQSGARESLGLSQHGPIVGLLPGSRPSELQRLLPVMLEAASLLHQQSESLQFVLPMAATLSKEALEVILAQYQQQCDSANLQPVTLTIIEQRACDVMRASDVVICASGTATLETALIGTPMVLVYKVSAVNYAIMKRLIRIPDIGLVNIVAGKRVVPELVQHDATAANIVKETQKLLTDTTARNTMIDALAAVTASMGDGNASERVAVLIRQLGNKLAQ